MKLKTLMYSHCCNRSFYLTRRAMEQQVLANKAVDIRMASMEQRATQHAQHQIARTMEQRATQHAQHQTARTTQKRDYSKLLSF
jgi:molybdenum cofactor biosynthesis enzyme MoaA